MASDALNSECWTEPAWLQAPLEQVHVDLRTVRVEVSEVNSELALEMMAVHERRLWNGSFAEHARDGGQFDVAVASVCREPGQSEARSLRTHIAAPSLPRGQAAMLPP